MITGIPRRFLISISFSDALLFTLSNIVREDNQFESVFWDNQIWFLRQSIWFLRQSVWLFRQLTWFETTDLVSETTDLIFETIDLFFRM